MKNILPLIFSITTFAVLGQSTIITPGDSQSSIQINSANSKGITIPSLTETQRDQLYNYPTGSIIYNSTCSCLNYYTGSQWRTLYAASYLPIDEYAPPTPISTKVLGSEFTLANSGTDQCNAIALANPGSSSNDFYITGRAWSQSPLGQNSIDGYFIARYGTPLWERKVSNAIGYDVAIDENGNVYTVGVFTNTSTFESGNPFTSQGGTDIFLAKYDPAGTLLWARKAGGTGDDMGAAISVGGGGIYLTGSFSNSNFTLDSPSNTVFLNSSGGKDIFIAKYDTNGNLIWARQAGGIGDDEAKDIGGSAIVGYFSNTATFGTTNSVSSGGKDIFYVQIDGNGNFGRVFAAGGTGDDVANGISSDGYITGYFSNTLTMHKPVSGTTAVKSLGGKDMFLAHIMNDYIDFNKLVARVLVRGGGVNDDEGVKIATNESGGSSTFLGVAGNFSGSADFGGPLLATNTQSGFLAVFSVDGKYEWGKSLSKTSTSSAANIAMKKYGARPYVVGVFDPYWYSTRAVPAYMQLWYVSDN